MKITITIEDAPTKQTPNGVTCYVGFEPVLTHETAQTPTPAMNVASALISQINPHVTWEAHVPH
jgi:hypothetical protein